MHTRANSQSRLDGPRLDGEPPSFLDRVVLAIASGGGAGFVLPAPGTYGALLGLGIAWFFERHLSFAAGWAAVVALSLVGIPLSTRAARILGRPDPGPVVWDEIASMPLVFFLCPYKARPWRWPVFSYTG